MMKQSFKAMHLVCFALFFGLNNVAHGYEVDTHEKISNAAAQQFIDLKHYDFTNLGLVSLDDSLTAEGLKCRSEKLSTQSALEWIQEGSVCEDDTFTETFARYRNHFYDPAHNGQGYTGFLWKNSGILKGMPSPDWVIDKASADGQLYSFSQGRRYFYDALTKPTDAERKANLARMFRTLGDVMHIMQDMAQPQHTRNDSHGLPKSNYEVYTNDHRDNLTYTGEPVPKFATAREYFTNLAQFTNNNFVSADTNFDKAASQGYTLPAQGAATDVPVHTLPDISPEVLAECNASKPCTMTFYSTNQTVSNPRASTLSILDQYLKLRPVTITDPVTSISYSETRVFSLNRFNFDSAHPFLIPRAVAYSAGILDYFFRGNIDMATDPDNPGKYLIRNRGTEDMTGNFALYYDAVDGNRYPVPNAAWASLTIAAGDQANNLSTMWPDNPAPQTPGEFTLVFNGTMGSEQRGISSTNAPDNSLGAVVSKKMQLQCRTLSIVMATDPPTSTTEVITPGINGSNFRVNYTYYRSGNSIGNGTKELVFPIQSGDPTSTTIYQGHIAYSNAKENPIVSTSLVGFVAPYPTSRGYYVLTGTINYEAIGNAGYKPISGSAVWTELAGSQDLGGNQTIIQLSDDTQLASFPYTILDGSGHIANYPINTAWSGNNWLDLYTDTNDGNGNWSPIFSQRVTFTVPAGVCTH